MAGVQAIAPCFVVRTASAADAVRRRGVAMGSWAESGSVSAHNALPILHME